MYYNLIWLLRFLFFLPRFISPLDMGWAWWQAYFRTVWFFTLGKWCLETVSIILVFRVFLGLWNVEECLYLEIASHPVWFLYQETIFNWLPFAYYWEKAMAPPLQYSCLENRTDPGAWWPAVHGVTKSRTWLSNFTFTFHFHALEKEMATHSSVLAWRIPGTGEPGGLPSMGSHRVGHDWSDLAAAALQYQDIVRYGDDFTEPSPIGIFLILSPVS